MINEGIEGVSKQTFLMTDESKSNSQIAPSADQDDDENDKRDQVTKQRESFLNIYKESDAKADDDGADEPDLSKGIRFKRDAEDDENGFELKTGPESAANAGGKPLI